MIQCNHCGFELRDTAKFCIQCGKMVVTPKPKVKRDMKAMVIPIVSGSGILLILISLFSILQIVFEDLDPIYLIVGGLIGSVLLFILTIFMYRSKKFDRTIITSMLLISEGIGYLSAFSFDLLARSTFSRHFLLVIALIVTTIGYLSIIKLQETFFQMIHRVIMIYLAWLTLFYTAGSDYLTPTVFTITALLIVLLIYGTSISYPSLPVLGASVIIEFLVYLDSSMINSTYIFLLGLLHIIIIPSILILRTSERINLMHIKGKFLNMILFLYFIPMISLLLAVGRGALLSFYPHLLLAIFGITWTIYLLRMKSIDAIENMSMISITTTSLLFFAIFVYALNVGGLELLFLYLGVLIITSLLRSYIVPKYQFVSRLLAPLIGILVVGQLYYNGYSLVLTYGIYLLSLIFVYLPEIRNKKLPQPIEMLGIVLFHSMAISIHFILYRTSIYLLVANAVVLLIAYILMSRASIAYRYVLVGIGYGIPAIFSFFYNEQAELIIIHLIISLAFLVLPIIEKMKRPQNAIFTWLLLSIPLVFGLSLTQNNWLINLTSVELFLFAFASLFLMYKFEMRSTWFVMFSLLSLIGRAAFYGDSIITDISVWSLSNLSLYTGFLIALMILQFTRSIDWIESMIHLLSGVLMGFIIAAYSDFHRDFWLAENIWIIMQLIVVFYLIIYTIQFLRFSDEQSLFSLAVIGFLNFLVMSLVETEWKNILWAVSILLHLAVVYRFNDQLGEKASFSWLASNLVNVIAFGLQNEIYMVFMFLIFFLLFITSPFIRLSMKLGERSLSILDVVLYGFLILLVVIFVLLSQMSAFYGLMTFYGITILQVIYILSSEKRFNDMTLMISVIFALFSTVFTAFEESGLIIQVVMWLGILIFSLVNRELIFSSHERSIFPYITYHSLGIAGQFMIAILTSLWYAINLRVVPEYMANRWLSLLMFVVLSLSLIVDMIRKQTTYFNDGLVISAFVLMLGSSLFGFYSTSTSNFILGGVAIVLTAIALTVKDNRMFRIGLALSLFSIIKFLIDLVILEESLDKYLSLLIVGIQAVYYAIIYSRISQLKTPIKAEDV
ncbi:MAG: zinc ribbon domain-containing protein [Candidatus Heimdallarchaeota archaeon]|nr:zinc ribbon domain-containing protein [Candidatus Heimdallarchaeota archaeon]